LSKRRPPPQTQQHNTPRGGLNGLLIIVVIATLVFVGLRLFSAHLDLTLDLSNPLSGTTILSYFAILTFVATPPAIWHAMFRSAIHRTGWDHAFFIGTLSLYIYFEMILGFGTLVALSLLFPTHQLFSLAALTGNPFMLGIFWILIFAPPAIFMGGPIIDAAHAEKHGMGASSGLGYVGFGMTMASAAYVLLKVLPDVGNIFDLFLSMISISLLVVIAIAIVIFGRQYKDPITWMTVAGVTVAVVLTISSVFGL